MAISPFYTLTGTPSVALCSAMAVSCTRNLPALLEWIREDRDTRLGVIRLQHRVGARFMKSLVKALSDGRSKARPLPIWHSERGNCFGVGGVAPAGWQTRATTGTGKACPRAVCLQHVRTGKRISAPSVAHLARRLRWGPNGTFHLDNVLKGKRLSHYGWGVPEILNAPLQLKDVFGNRYEETVVSVLQKVGAQAANKLRRTGAYQTLVLADKDLSHVVAPAPDRVTGYLYRKGYQRGPGRPLARIDRLVEAPEKLGISVASANLLARGLRQSIRGVTFIKAHKEAKEAFPGLTPVEV